MATLWGGSASSEPSHSQAVWAKCRCNGSFPVRLAAAVKLGQEVLQLVEEAL